MTSSLSSAAAGKVADICTRHSNRPDALIEILHDVQEALGHVPEAALPPIADALNLSRAEVYGVVTFYHDFHFEKQGKHVIKICRAEACQAAGGREVIATLEKVLKCKLGETTKNGKVTLEATYCLGLCPMGPAALIDGKPKAAIKPKTVAALVKELA
jgi:formate dehydrogenase subunit gamma